jgi:hypothetical protein
LGILSELVTTQASPNGRFTGWNVVTMMAINQKPVAHTNAGNEFDMDASPRCTTLR